MSSESESDNVSTTGAGGSFRCRLLCMGVSVSGVAGAACQLDAWCACSTSMHNVQTCKEQAVRCDSPHATILVW